MNEDLLVPQSSNFIDVRQPAVRYQWSAKLSCLCLSARKTISNATVSNMASLPYGDNFNLLNADIQNAVSSTNLLGFPYITMISPYMTRAQLNTAINISGADINIHNIYPGLKVRITGSVIPITLSQLTSDKMTIRQSWSPLSLTPNAYFAHELGDRMVSGILQSDMTPTRSIQFIRSGFADFGLNSRRVIMADEGNWDKALSYLTMNIESLPNSGVPMLSRLLLATNSTHTGANDILGFVINYDIVAQASSLGQFSGSEIATPDLSFVILAGSWYHGDSSYKKIMACLPFCKSANSFGAIDDPYISIPLSRANAASAYNAASRTVAPNPSDPMTFDEFTENVVTPKSASILSNYSMDKGFDALRNLLASW
jgi:hypothetical protein